MHLNKFLDQKVIWITGASGGLGRELAVALSKYRVKLVLSARDQLNLTETQKLSKLSDERCLIAPLDLTQLKEDQTQKIKDQILLKYGALDIIIHNASVSQRSLAHETSSEVERKIMETLFFGPVQLTKGILPTLLKSASSQIVIVSSLAGKFGVPMRSTYSAAKHALHGFFEAMALELNEKVDIAFFVLGGVRTDSAKHALNADGSQHNQLDIWHNRNMPANECALQIIKNLPKKRGEFVIGKFEKIGLFLRKHFPRLHQKILLKFFSKEKESRDLK